MVAEQRPSPVGKPRPRGACWAFELGSMGLEAGWGFRRRALGHRGEGAAAVAVAWVEVEEDCFSCVGRGGTKLEGRRVRYL